MSPTPAGQAGADARLPGVEHHGHLGFLDRRVDRIEPLLVRRERLQRRMELEPAHAVFADEPADLLDRHVGLLRIDGAEGDQHVGMVGCGIGDSKLDTAGWPSAVVASTVKITAAIDSAR